jgi:hypothetical protein
VPPDKRIASHWFLPLAVPRFGVINKSMPRGTNYLVAGLKGIDLVGHVPPYPAKLI